MKLFSINKWGELFENNRSRTVKDLDWVSIPNRHDGENYTKIVSDKDGAEIFSGWNLIVQVASKCKPRGVLVKDSGQPHDSASLSMKTRAPKSWFDKAFSFISRHTDWLLVKDVSEDYQHPDSLPPDKCEEGNGREGKEGKGNTTGGLPKEVEFWNLNCGTLSKALSVNDDRSKRLRQRRQDSFWVANFEQAVKRVAQSSFCIGGNDRQWKADFDWMLQPNVVAKIMEGKYDNRISTPIKPSIKLPTEIDVLTYCREKGGTEKDWQFAKDWHRRMLNRGYKINGRICDWKIKFSADFAAQRA
jgi:hypothetical protein